ncbi:MAG TPA: small ribosomal subunit Rsm22 family protein [Nitrospira sp.]|nr:small ribosomal subunit Rsm22 family protein [Nitrospira sp.]
MSALLLETLDRIQQEDGGVGIQQRASAVGELSRLFTKGRDALGSGYLNNPALAAAYLTYFFPVNLSKIQVLLDELPHDWHNAGGENRPLRVLDLGSGPGTGALAVLDWLNGHAPDRLKHLTVVAVDVSADALSQAQRLWGAYTREANIRNARLVHHQGDLGDPTSGWRDDVAQRGPYDLIIVANCLNELFGRTRHCVKERSGLIAHLLTRLKPHGTLMLIEPALRDTSRALHEVRDLILLEKRCTVYSPCLHEGNCPALANPHDWCHEERAWEPPASIQRIDREVGFIKDALKFSYVLLRTDGRTIAERSPSTFRMVSELRKLKGDTRAWLCNELGRPEVGRLDRAQSTSNSAWNECQRGTIVRIKSITRKDGATLGRIPENAAVDIVRFV